MIDIIISFFFCTTVYFFYILILAIIVVEVDSESRISEWYAGWDAAMDWMKLNEKEDCDETN